MNDGAMGVLYKILTTNKIKQQWKINKVSKNKLLMLFFFKIYFVANNIELYFGPYIFFHFWKYVRRYKRHCLFWLNRNTLIILFRKGSLCHSSTLEIKSCWPYFQVHIPTLLLALVVSLKHLHVYMPIHLGTIVWIYVNIFHCFHCSYPHIRKFLVKTNCYFNSIKKKNRSYKYWSILSPSV